MKLNKTSYLAGGIIFLLVLFSMLSAAEAVELDDKLQIHGYGHQGFLLTDKNEYLKADNNGTWEYTALALLFSYKATDEMSIWAQIFGNNEDFRLDWAFVDYHFSNEFRVNAGQIKFPVGFYNEIRDVKYLQLSTIEPYIYHESVELVNESFRGVQAIYNFDSSAGTLSLEAYGGQIVVFEEDADEEFKNSWGGRITYRTPIEGLTFMGSAFTSKIIEEEVEESGETVENEGHKTLWMASAEYVNNNFDLKTEYAQHKVFDIKSDSWYVQAGYTFIDKLTPFARYDYITTDKKQKSDPSFYQKDLSLGIGYKVNSYVSLKVEDHLIRGYALPVASEEIEAGEGEKNWNQFAASINFMF